MRARSHDRVVTPYTDPDRWTEEEKALYDRGLCTWDMGADWANRDPYCRQPSKQGASFGHCPEHEAKLLADCWPDGTFRIPHA